MVRGGAESPKPTDSGRGWLAKKQAKKHTLELGGGGRIKQQEQFCFCVGHEQHMPLDIVFLLLCWLIEGSIIELPLS